MAYPRAVTIQYFLVIMTHDSNWTFAIDSIALIRFNFWIKFAQKFDSKCRNLIQKPQNSAFWVEFLHFESNFSANSIQKMNQINAIESIAKVQFESLVMITKKYWIVTALAAVFRKDIVDLAQSRGPVCGSVRPDDRNTFYFARPARALSMSVRDRARIDFPGRDYLNLGTNRSLRQKMELINSARSACWF